MDALAENGSRLFCSAAHAVGTASFEMQTCGDFSNRYWIGVSTTLAVITFAIFAIWHLAFSERGAG